MSVAPSIEVGSQNESRTQLNRPALEILARLLEDTGDFRVTRRLAPTAPSPAATCTPVEKAVFVDVETTGLDAGSDEIIEVALVPFSFTQVGEIVAVHAAFDGLRQPSRPLLQSIVELTGIDDAMLAGKKVLPQDLDPYLDEVALVVAHNAAFDRAFLERAFPVFRSLPWACSHADVPWRDEGIRSSNLEALAGKFGFFYDAHRAADDCHAAIEVLGRRLPRSGTRVMRALLDSVGRPTFRIWAQGAPFDAKNALKGRGYRWHPGTGGGPRAWYRDVTQECVDAELAYLRASVFGRGSARIPVVAIDALDRHSERSWRV